jgi:hypothetical protein
LCLLERSRRRGRSFAYADENGFEREATCRYGRARWGQLFHGLRTGQTRSRTSLIAARFEGGLPPSSSEGTTTPIPSTADFEKSALPVAERATRPALGQCYGFNESSKNWDFYRQKKAAI